MCGYARTWGPGASSFAWPMLAAHSYEALVALDCPAPLIYQGWLGNFLS